MIEHTVLVQGPFQPDWTVIEVDSGHNVIGEQPEFLVEMLLAIAGH